MIDFFNSGNVVQDKNAKSLSYYFKKEVASIDKEIIQQMKNLSIQNGRSNLRICLHTSPAANFHEMIILEYRGLYYRPHKHLSKGESCHIIEGKVAFLVFNDDGTLSASNIVSQDNCLISRVGINRWHVVIPISDYTIYHESKPGPFLSEGDSIYPNWAPDGSNPAEAKVFMDKIVNAAMNGVTE